MDAWTDGYNNYKLDFLAKNLIFIKKHKFPFIGKIGPPTFLNLPTALIMLKGSLVER